MVFAAALLAFAYIFASTAVPATAYFFRNLGTGLWMTDYNFTSTEEVGNPIVGARFDSSNSAYQWWTLETFPTRYFYALTNPRPDGTAHMNRVTAKAEAVELANLETARGGSATSFVLRNPDDTDHDVFSFVLFDVSANLSLAITATSVENQPLLLTKYNPDLATQRWTTYTHLSAAVAGRPITHQDLRPATRAEMLAATKED